MIISVTIIREKEMFPLSEQKRGNGNQCHEIKILSFQIDLSSKAIN